MSGLIQLSNATIKISSIDGVAMESPHSLAKLYINGVSVSVTNDMARKVKRLLEKQEN